MKIYVGQKKIPVLIDKEDLYLTKVKGHYLSITNHGYVRIMIRIGIYKNGYYKYSHSYLHRKIMNAPKNLEVDHINRNRLDNRKCNLRLCTSTNNLKNKKSISGNYKGVHFNKLRQKWIAQITKDYICYHIGSFDTEKEAVIAYNKRAKKLHGKFAFINKIK